MFENSPLATKVAASSIGLLMLAGCANNKVNFDISDVDQRHVTRGFVFNDVNFRAQPEVHEVDPTDNLCATPGTALVLDNRNIFISGGTGADNNGPWVGVDPSMIKVPLKNKLTCKDLYGGKIWVAKKFADIATVSFANTTGAK